MLLTTITSTANILGNPEEPHKISNADSQLLYGEQFQVEQEHGIYVYGYSVLDGYKGYVERDQLVKDAEAENVIVKVRATHLYPAPDFKSRPVDRLSFLSRITARDETQNGFTKTEDNYWVYSDHIAPIENFKLPDDLAQIATVFLGTPYLFAGRSSFGIDCSGLVQQSLKAHGLSNVPRDSRDQQKELGNLEADTALQRNDIVFFKGHVGIMMDDQYILNATARHMSTVIEDINDLKTAYGDILKIARL